MAHMAEQGEMQKPMDDDKLAAQWTPLRKAGEQMARALESYTFGLHLTQHEARDAIEAWRRVVPLPPEIPAPERIA